MSEEKCENCKFARGIEVWKDDVKELGKLKCCRFPKSGFGGWPTVGKNDWCGEFKSKYDEAREDV